MTSVLGLEVSIFRVPLDVADRMLITQQCGYFHLWRFLNSDGSLSLEGEIGVTFGGQWDAERVPFGYNTKLQLAVPVDRVLLTWSAQPGRVAEILMTRDPRGLDGENAPARQLVFQGQATQFTTGNVTVGTVAAQIVAPNARRSRVVISAASGNPAAVFIGPVGVTTGNGLPLEPGQSFVGFSSAEYRAISTAAGCVVRTMEELA